jgi:hypothetical protein
MTLEEMIFARLTTYSAMNALIGNRCYPQILPQEPTLPAVTYDVRAAPTAEGSINLARVDVQINGWATTYAGAIQLGEAVKAALEGYQQKVDKPALIGMAVESELDLFEAETGLYGRVVEVSAWVVT